MKKILIVDDNQEVADMLSKYLTLKGYEVSVTNDGRNGLTLIQNNGFDVIILDIAMPDFSGMDVIDALEKDGKLKDNKIVLFSASPISDDTMNEMLSKEGVKACIKKPAKLAEILEIISKV